MATAYVVLNRPDLTSRDHFVLYVAVVDSKAAALEAVKAKFNPAGELEINGSALQASTLEALGLKPDPRQRLPEPLAARDGYRACGLKACC